MGIVVILLVLGYVLWEITGILVTDEVEVRKKNILGKVTGSAFQLTHYETTNKVVTVRGLVEIGEECHKKSVEFQVPETIFQRENPEASLVIIVEGSNVFLQDHSQKEAEKYKGKFF